MPTNESAEQILREMYRRSRDTIRIYNPLEVDFRFKWDGVWNKVPAKTEKDVERYLAEKYFHDISQYILGLMAMEQGTKMIEERRAKGMVEFMNKYDENKAVWDNVQKMNDNEKLKEVAEQVIIGLVEEFGAEMPPDNSEVVQENSMVPTEVSILNSITERKMVRSPLQTKPVIKPLKKTLASEVSI